MSINSGDKMVLRGCCLLSSSKRSCFILLITSFFIFVVNSLWQAAPCIITLESSFAQPKFPSLQTPPPFVSALASTIWKMFTSGPRPNYGAVGATFLSARAMQLISMICVTGLASNFVSEIVSSNLEAPRELVGTLSVVCVGIVYCIITLVCYADNILPFLFNTAIDSFILIALIVVTVIIGRPLTYLNCRAIGDEDQAASAWDLSTALKDTLNQPGDLLYVKLVDTSKTTCLEMKAMWGLSIALCILFTFSALSSIVLWRRKPAAAKVVSA